jgi:hypothetical protein
MSHNITIEGGKSVRLKTAGKFCDRDIVVTAEGGSGGDGYVVCNSDSPSSNNTVNDLEQLRISYPNATSVGGHAFSGCRGLYIIDLPSATTIGESAFQNCATLESIYLPKATSIGGVAFSGCTSLTTATLDVVTSIARSVFSGCKQLLSVLAPQATSVGGWAFFECPSLEIVVAQLSTIGERAFEGCASLTDLNFSSVTTIDEWAFRGCSLLRSIDLPQATSVGGHAFYECPSVENISLPIATSIGEYAFYECQLVTGIDLPKATSIGGSAFWGCTSLDTLILGNTETVCNLDLTAIMGTKIATTNGEPTGEGFIYVPEAFYEQYMTNLTEQAYMLLVYSGYSEEEAEYLAPYIISAILRTIEGSAQATTFGLRNPLANFHGFTQEAIELFKANYKGARTE